MERSATETVPTLNGWKGGSIELADGADKSVRVFRGRCAVSPSYLDHPGLRVCLVAGLGHFGREADAGVQSQFLRHPPEIGQEVGLGRVPPDPGVTLSEGKAVQLIGHIDPAPGIDVLEPGATHVVVLFKDGDRKTRLTEPIGGRQARDAGADDGTAKVPGWSYLLQAPTRSPGIGARQRQLLDQEVAPLRGRGRADEEVEDPSDLIGTDLVRWCT